MKTRKFLMVFLVSMLIISLVGCSANEQAKEEPKEAQGKYKDGIYFAQEDAFSEKSGWKYVVTLEVKDGKIAKADWNGAQVTGGPSKKEFSKLGQYPMVEQGGAKAPWHEQAAKVEAYLIEKQDPSAITYKEDNYHSDDIAGATIGVSPLFKLAEKALANGPVEPGKYKDGAYYAQDDGYSKGYKYGASLTVINGYIVAADWVGLNINGGKDKETLSKDGEYPMVEQGGAKAPWHEQAAIAEAYLLEKQDPTITYKEDKYHTDDIASVTIGVSPFFKNAEKALANGPIPISGPYKDGFYYNEEKEFASNGWKYNVYLTVKNGAIVGVDWNGLHQDGGDDKDALSAKGEYELVAKGGAQAEWHEQATKAEAYLLETQDPTKISYKDDTGATDDIAGVSIKVGAFFKMAEEVLK